MGRKIIGENKKQGTFSFCYLRDMLPNDHIVFLFEKLVEKLDISCIKNSYGSRGGSYHDPFNMLCVILYGYSKGIRSSRKLEEAVSENMPFYYLAGGTRISHSSIAQFIQRHKEASRFFTCFVC